MKPVLFAALTALCWSSGSFFEKKGLAIAGMPPVMGITIRTAVAIIVLGTVSYPHWHTLQGIALKPLLYLILGGGVLAGSLGMLFFYSAIGSGLLSRVIPVAFGLTPLIGFIIGAVFLNEPVSSIKAAGVVFICAGVYFVTKG